jgi:hypothetical protein
MAGATTVPDDELELEELVELLDAKSPHAISVSTHDTRAPATSKYRFTRSSPGSPPVPPGVNRNVDLLADYAPLHDSIVMALPAGDLVWAEFFAWYAHCYVNGA